MNVNAVAHAGLLRILVGLINRSFALGTSFRSLLVTLARIAFDIWFMRKLVFRVGENTEPAYERIKPFYPCLRFKYNDERRTCSRQRNSLRWICEQ